MLSWRSEPALPTTNGMAAPYHAVVVALSRRKQGFESPRERQLFQ
jgi:hypothetical protein